MKSLYFSHLILVFFIFLIFTSCSQEDIKIPPKDFMESLPSYFGDEYHIPDDNKMSEDRISLGRMLFYDKRLSIDNTVACASCHQQSKAFTDGLAKAVGVRGQQSPRGSMALANLLWDSRFHWDGEFTSLEQQVLSPITNPLEMDQSLEATLQKLRATQGYVLRFERAFGDTAITADRLAKALAQFVRSMVSQDSRYDQYLRGEYEPTAQELRGEVLFFTHPEPAINLRGGNCGDCHLGPRTGGSTNGLQGFHNNGLDTDEDLSQGLARITGQAADRGKFKAPSLRNIALTAPYMHDGRFATLEQVLDHYNDHIRMSSTLDPLIEEASNQRLEPGEPIRLHLTDQEKQDIIAFLGMLTDDAFVNNPKFSKPDGLE